MRIDLCRHQCEASSAVTRVTAAFDRQGAHLWLRYVVDCPGDAIILGGPAAPARTDGLWQSTCLEAFLQPGDGPGYTEYNFAPDSRWAAYAFDATRVGMRPLDVPMPQIHLEAGADWFAIEVEIEHAADPTQDIALGLAAVIEETGGAKSYWALRHPADEPDFHHRDCFAITLEATAPA